VLGDKFAKFEKVGCNLGIKSCKQIIQVLDNKTTQYQRTNYICNFYSNTVVTKEVWAFNL
jgi:hypothetical protein